MRMIFFRKLPRSRQVQFSRPLPAERAHFENMFLAITKSSYGIMQAFFDFDALVPRIFTIP